MDSVMDVVVKMIENAANLASASTSFICFYQPEKPECLKKTDSENK